MRRRCRSSARRLRGGHLQHETRLDWARLRRVFSDETGARFRTWIDPDSAHYAQNLAFAMGRLEEGRQLAHYFASRLDRRPIRVLDVGAGNGGVALALANSTAFQTEALDLVPNHQLRALRRRTGLPVLQMVADARSIPLPDASRDLVLALEILEHLPSPAAFGAEVMRILRPGGRAMVTTPARLRHLLHGDPHFDLRCLLLLPDRLQRLVVTRLARRRVLSHLGTPTVLYDVEHIYWHARGISSLFSGPKSVEILWNTPFPGPTKIHNLLWSLFRSWLWDRIVITKEG